MELIVAVVVGIAVGGLVVWFAQEVRAKGRIATLDADHRETVAGLQGQLEQSKTGEALLETAKEEMRNEFQAAASRAIANNNEQFLQLANENLGKTMESAKGELEQRHQQFQELVKPLAENYNKLDPTLNLLMKQNTTLTEKTTDLSNALRDNRRAGSWGEVQLRRVVELADMTAYCDFREQATVEGSSDRPDLIVRMPENRTVIVDAKTSTAAFLDAYEAESEEGADEAMLRHAKALKSKVDELSRKQYGVQEENSLDFVVMFIPGDQFLSAALSKERDLVTYAMEKNVAIATPASLFALLCAIERGWKQHRLARDAAEIAKVGEEMFRRMEVFLNHYQRVGKNLDTAVKSYNDSVRSFDRRIAPQGRRFAQLIRNTEEAFPDPEELEAGVMSSAYMEALPPGSEDGQDVEETTN